MTEAQCVVCSEGPWTCWIECSKSSWNRPNFARRRQVTFIHTTYIYLFCLNITLRRVYHIVTDHAFWVESIMTYHRIYRKKCITQWRITLSIYYTYLTHDFIKPNVEEGSFMPLVLIHTGIVKYLWQILILYSIQFAYPTYSGSPFSDEIAIMIRHYVIHPYLKIRHYVIHPTIRSV